MGAVQKSLVTIEPGQEWDTIALFEQMLDTQPDDLPALDVLMRAYQSVGDLSSATRYAARLAEAALRVQDRVQMECARDWLSKHAAGDSALAAVMQRLIEKLTPSANSPQKPAAATAAAMQPPLATARPAPDVVSRLRLRMVPRSTAGADEPEPTPPAAAVPALPAVQNADVNEALGRVNAFLGGAAMPASGESAAHDADYESAPTTAPAKRRKINPLSDTGRRRTIVSEEMNLAWDLQEAGLLSEEHYAAVVRDLTELSSSEIPVTIAALHALQFRSFANIEQVLHHVSEKSETPMLPLASFDPQGTAFGNLPLAYMIVQGVIPFECLGPDLLVALLNPLNERIRLEVQELTGHTCHFYLTAPADFDAMLETVKNRYAGVSVLRQ